MVASYRAAHEIFTAVVAHILLHIWRYGMQMDKAGRQGAALLRHSSRRSTARQPRSQQYRRSKLGSTARTAVAH